MAYKNQQNKVSTVNSTTTNLGANATFTGAWEDVLHLSNIRVSVAAGVASASGGLVVQYSDDQSFIVDVEDGYTINANDKKTFSFGAAARYFRIVYTNGAAAQTGALFKISTTIRYNQDKPSSHKVSELINDNTDAEMVKAVLSGRDEAAGTYGNFSAIPITNTTTTVYGFATIPASRPSILSGRTSVRQLIDLSANTNVRTNTSGKKLYITDVALSVQNSSGLTAGRLNIRDSTTAGGGTIILPILTNVSSTVTFTITFLEPLQVSTALYFNISTGTLTVTGTINGYEE